MPQRNHSSSDNLNKIFELNQKAVLFAEDNDWDAALTCINKRHHLLLDFFDQPQANFLRYGDKISQLSKKIEAVDEQLKTLASNARVDIKEKISHLSLSKKASNAYQKIATQI